MTFDEYVKNIDEKWKDSFLKIWHTIEAHLPVGFIVDIQHGIPGFAVPKSTYPDGYHVDQAPTPFYRSCRSKTSFGCLPHGTLPR